MSRYHIVGAHGGVWIMDVDSHEELERLLGGSPGYNFSHFDVKALTEMSRVTAAFDSSSPSGARLGDPGRLGGARWRSPRTICTGNGTGRAPAG